LSPVSIISVAAVRADASQHEGADRRRDETDADLAQREEGARARDGDVGHRGQPHAAAHGRAVDAADERDRQLVEGAERVGQQARLLEVVLERSGEHGLHPAQVRAGAERRLGAGEDHQPDVPIAGQAGQGAPELVEHRGVEGVAHLGAVQGQAGDVPLHVDLDRLGHGNLGSP
jgi:hypothetical protein